MKAMKAPGCLLLAATVALGCGQSGDILYGHRPTGAAKVTMTFASSAVSSLAVDAVELTVSGPGYLQVLTLVPDGLNPLTETFNGLMVGVYTFSAEARFQGTPLFSGETTFEVTSGTVGTILLTLHQVVPPGTVDVIAPRINSMAVVTPTPIGTDPGSPATVIGVPITLTANTTDTLEGANPTYQWSSSCGGTLEPPLPGADVVPDVFSAPSGPAPVGTGDVTTTFTSYCNGVETITFWIADDTPQSGSIRAKVSFAVNYVPQGAALTIEFDQYPDITGMRLAAPGDVPFYGETVSLVAAVEIHNGYGLTYAWTDSCTGAAAHGVFTGADTLTPAWQAPPGGVMPAVCMLTLTIQELPPGNGQNTASLTLDITNGTITVMFFDLDLTVVGRGSVASVPAGMACAADSTCTAPFGKGYDVALTATADTSTDPGTRVDFSGWSGACSGTTATCNLTMDSAKSVQATFTTFHQLSVQLPVFPTAYTCCTPTDQCYFLPGFGEFCIPGIPSCGICFHFPEIWVQSAPPGIDCATGGGSVAGQCSAWFPAGTAVLLANGAVLGCDAGAPDCTVTMDAPRSVSY